MLQLCGVHPLGPQTKLVYMSPSTKSVPSVYKHDYCCRRRRGDAYPWERRSRPPLQIKTHQAVSLHKPGFRTITSAHRTRFCCPDATSPSRIETYAMMLRKYSSPTVSRISGLRRDRSKGGGGKTSETIGQANEHVNCSGGTRVETLTSEKRCMETITRPLMAFANAFEYASRMYRCATVDHYQQGMKSRNRETLLRNKAQGITKAATNPVAAQKERKKKRQ